MQNGPPKFTHLPAEARTHRPSDLDHASPLASTVFCAGQGSRKQHICGLRRHHHRLFPAVSCLARAARAQDLGLLGRLRVCNGVDTDGLLRCRHHAAQRIVHSSRGQCNCACGKLADRPLGSPRCPFLRSRSLSLASVFVRQVPIRGVRAWKVKIKKKN